jgi:hypothetical protein
MLCGCPSLSRWALLTERSRLVMLLLVLTMILCNHAVIGTIEADLVSRTRLEEKASPGLRGLSKTSINQEELDFCIANLEFAAIDGQVSEEEFILFLENFSQQPLYFDEFHELPLQLVLVFYTAACTGGRNCSTEEPKISLENVGVSKAFLHIFCSSVREVALIQINFKFQYQIRLASHQDHFFVTENGNSQHGEGEGELIRHLEHASELVLLKELGCVGESGLGFSRTLRGQLGSDDSDSLEETRASILNRPSSNDKDETGESQTRDDILHDRRHLYEPEKVDCDYSVLSAVNRWLKMQCLGVPKSTSMENSPIDEDETCLLVFSEVRVTAASLFQELTSRELRSVVSSALKTAILGEEFDKYLTAQSLNP